MLIWYADVALRSSAATCRGRMRARSEVEASGSGRCALEAEVWKKTNGKLEQAELQDEEEEEQISPFT